MKTVIRSFIREQNYTIRKSIGEIIDLKAISEGGNSLVYEGEL